MASVTGLSKIGLPHLSETKDIKDAGVFNGKVRLHVGVVASFKVQVEVEQA